MSSRPQNASGSTPDWARWLLVWGALLGFGTVVMGAVSAHLPDRALASGGRDMLRSAVQMQGWHAMALLVTGLLGGRDHQPGRLLLGLAGLAFGTGIVAFCLGVYPLALVGRHGWAQLLGHAAPLGGGILMLGWLLLALSCARRPRNG